MNLELLQEAFIPLRCIESKFIGRDFVQDVLQDEIQKVRRMEKSETAAALLEELILNIADKFDVDFE